MSAQNFLNQKPSIAAAFAAATVLAGCSFEARWGADSDSSFEHETRHRPAPSYTYPEPEVVEAVYLDCDADDYNPGYWYCADPYSGEPLYCAENTHGEVELEYCQPDIPGETSPPVEVEPPIDTETILFCDHDDDVSYCAKNPDYNYDPAYDFENTIAATCQAARSRR